MFLKRVSLPLVAFSLISPLQAEPYVLAPHKKWAELQNKYPYVYDAAYRDTIAQMRRHACLMLVDFIRAVEYEYDMFSNFYDDVISKHADRLVRGIDQTLADERSCAFLLEDELHTLKTVRTALYNRTCNLDAPVDRAEMHAAYECLVSVLNKNIDEVLHIILNEKLFDALVPFCIDIFLAMCTDIGEGHAIKGCEEIVIHSDRSPEDAHRLMNLLESCRDACMSDTASNDEKINKLKDIVDFFKTSSDEDVITWASIVAILYKEDARQKPAIIDDAIIEYIECDETLSREECAQLLKKANAFIEASLEEKSDKKARLKVFLALLRLNEEIKNIVHINNVHQII